MKNKEKVEAILDKLSTFDPNKLTATQALDLGEQVSDIELSEMRVRIASNDVWNKALLLAFVAAFTNTDWSKHPVILSMILWTLASALLLKSGVYFFERRNRKRAQERLSQTVDRIVGPRDSEQA